MIGGSALSMTQSISIDLINFSIISLKKQNLYNHATSEAIVLATWNTESSRIICSNQRVNQHHYWAPIIFRVQSVNPSTLDLFLPSYDQEIILVSCNGSSTTPSQRLPSNLTLPVRMMHKNLLFFLPEYSMFLVQNFSVIYQQVIDTGAAFPLVQIVLWSFGKNISYSSWKPV